MTEATPNTLCPMPRVNALVKKMLAPQPRRQKKSLKRRHMREVLRRDFASFSELVEASRKVPPELAARVDLSDANRGRVFASWDEVYRALEQPWPEGLAMLETLEKKCAGLDVVVKSRRRVGRWSEDTGDDLDWDRLQAGQAWWRQTLRDVTVGGSQFATILVNISTPWVVRPQDVFWPCAAAITLADLLENAGYRVRIVGAELTSGRYCPPGGFIWDTGSLTTVTIKDFEAPINKTTLATMFSGWAYRTMFFRYAYGAFDGYTARGSLGTVEALQDHPELWQDDYQDTLSFVYDYVHRVSHSAEYATAWIHDTVDYVNSL